MFTARIAQNDYRASLKQVKKKEFEIEEDKVSCSRLINDS